MKTQQLVMLGGTGFVGHHLVPRLVADGHRVLLLSRNRERHRDLAVLPGVQVRSADVHDGDALAAQLEGADAVLNLVGILNPVGRDDFRRVHVELTRTLVSACAAAGVTRLHQMSSLKAGQGLSQYLKTRGEAEALVRQSPLAWTIYQPSVIFGEGDGLVTRFARLLRMSPLLPLARPRAKLAPVHVGDVAEAIARCVATPRASTGRTFELYGPDTLALGELVRLIRDACGLKRMVIDLPDGLGRVQAQLLGLLPGTPFSLDNFKSLRTDSVGKVDGLAALGIVPHRLAPMLPALLQGTHRQHRYRALRDLRRRP